MPTEHNEPHPDDAGIEELLREVGVRHEPSAEASRAVEDAIHREWRAMLEQRRRVRRNVVWGAAAGVAAVIVGFGVVAPRLSGLATIDVATVARVDGQLLAGARADELRARLTGVPIRRGELLRTDARSRAALTLVNGVSVRLDRGTALAFVAGDRVELRSGAIYIDARALRPAEERLTVQTRAGSVRHVGTQYQVRSYIGDIAVSVREGSVLIEHQSGSSLGGSGESIRVTTHGEVTRTAISPQDPSWSWAAEAAPPFDIENQTLSAFLQWLARETGRQVEYATPQAASAAQNLRLRGSIEGLDLDTALAAVLSTTRLRRYETTPGTIGIALSPPVGSAQ